MIPNMRWIQHSPKFESLAVEAARLLSEFPRGTHDLARPVQWDSQLF
jgi:hypothetical protein